MKVITILLEYNFTDLGEGTPELNPELSCDGGWWLGVPVHDNITLALFFYTNIMEYYDSLFIQITSIPGYISKW